MKDWLLLLFAGLISLYPGVSVSQAQGTLSFRHIDSRHGLSQNSVFSIVQDGDGFMWLGTRSGLNRYDGYRMRSYQQGDTAQGELIGDDIRALYYDEARNYLWVCTPQGLSRYRPVTDDFQSFVFQAEGESEATVEVVRDVLRDGRGQLWVATDRGLYRWDEQAQRFYRCARPRAHFDPAQPWDVNVLFADQQGQVWAGSNQGLYPVCLDAQQRVRYDVGVDSVATTAMFRSHVRAIAQDPGGRLWVGTPQEGLYSWLPGEAPRQYRHDPDDPLSLSNDNVRAIAVDDQGRVWVGTFLGLNIYAEEKDGFRRAYQDAAQPHSLASNSVRSICFDSRGSAWIGTYYGGISYYHPDAYRFTHHSPRANEQGLSHAIVSSFQEDEQGNLWIGTEGGGLNYWDRRQDHYRHYRQEAGGATGLSGNNVKAIHLRGDSLWIGTFASGLNLLRLDRGQWQHFGQGSEGPGRLSDDNVYALVQDGRDLWIATYGGGLNRMDLRQGQVRAFRHQAQDSLSLNSDLTRCLLQDPQGRLWIGTDEGLDRMDPKAEEPQSFEHFLPGKMICALLLSRDGLLWVGTFKHGVMVLDQSGKLQGHFSPADGLPGQTAFGLLEDEKGRVWVSSERGLAKIDPRDGSVTGYNYSDGLDNLEYNFNAYYRARSGEMFFGGIKGFTSFFPDEIRTNTFVPPLAFTYLQTFNQPVRPGDETGLLQQDINASPHLTFPYNRANFSLGFAALDYLNPDNNQYSYRLEGLEQEWKQVKGQTEVSYTLQRPGDYTFQLKGGNNDGIWNQQSRSIRVTVLPPPWRTHTAYLLYFLLLLGIVLGAYRFIQMRHRLQIETLTKAQQEELHQAKMRFYTNVTHEFRTPLTLILGPVEELLRQGLAGRGERQLQSIRQNAERLLRLVNQLLNFRSLEHDHDRLQVAPGNLVKFVREVHLSFQEQARLAEIDYELSVAAEEIEVWFDRDKLEKVLYNLLANAFKFTPRGGRIHIRLGADRGEAWLEICDSGPGVPEAIKERIFERFFHLEGDQVPVGTGIGLALARQLVGMHGGRLELKERAAGACFAMRLPLGKDHFAPEHLLSDFRDSEDLSAYVAKAARDPRPLVDLTEAPPEDGPRASLLIVEDNPSVQAYVRDMFAATYTVHLADDGAQGLEKAQELSPDLIISDVMMPRLDGINFCRELKSRVETSHIPVVMLTARTGQIFRVEGLETGADAYLTKPFSPYELKLQVRNLLEGRRRIRERFQQVLTLEPREITLTSPDETFLAKAMAIVEEHMDDPEFKVEVFAHELGVSRPLLFTKLKAITDQTPNNFVKTLRLKRSAQLLSQSELGVAEVAYEVGFRDPRYFSKCFQKQFGQLPSEYRAERVG